MSRQEAKLPLKTSLTSLASNFLQILQLDTAIFFKRIVSALVFGLIALLFGFLIWIYFIYNFYNFLFSQGVNHETILFAIFAINALMLIIFWVAAYKQLSKTNFIYSSYALRKLKNLGAQNE